MFTVAAMFGQSRILTSTEEASALFHSMPAVTKRVSSHLVFQGGEAAALAENEVMDIHEIKHALSDIESPTLFLCKSGDYIFGAYASTPWKFTDEPHGSPKSYVHQ
jgi:hypothetical protein